MLLLLIVGVDKCEESGGTPTKLTDKSIDGIPSVSLTASPATNTPEPIQQILNKGTWTSLATGTSVTISLVFETPVEIMALKFKIEGASRIHTSVKFDQIDDEVSVSTFV